jgi:Fe2+ or Zn2+ uptake regulation protein
MSPTELPSDLLSESELAMLRARGHRLTPQRILILRAVKASSGHITAEQIHAEVAPRLPSLNVATIYRTLQWLNEAGLVSVTDLGAGSLVYEYHAANPHHHLICERCRQVVEIDHTALESLKADLNARYGFAAHFEHLAIFGRCGACRDT